MANLYMGRPTPSGPPGRIQTGDSGPTMGPPAWGGNPITNPIQNGPLTPPSPVATPKPVPAPGSVLGPQAIRATGPTNGFDPAYLQNLATTIGSLFTGGKQTGNVTNINPLGDLSDISPKSNIGGTAPGSGAPLTWLQKALNGGGFGFTPPVVKPKPPVVRPAGPTNGPATGRYGS